MERDPQTFVEIYRRKLDHARRLLPEQKFLASLKHSDEVAAVMRDGLRHQFPTASEEEITRLLRERVHKIRQLDERR